MTLFRLALAATCLIVAACAPLHSPLPLREGPPPAAQSATVYAGHARAFRYLAGEWQRMPEHDYDFILLEQRFAGRWETVKEIHRRNPSYDGRGGPRDQTLHFVVLTRPASDGGLDLAVEGTLGSGKGHQAANGNVELELAAADRGWLIPFDTIRLRQNRATAGQVAETLELFSRREGREVPFMKLEEEGTVFKPVAP